MRSNFVPVCRSVVSITLSFLITCCDRIPDLSPGSSWLMTEDSGNRLKFLLKLNPPRFRLIELPRHRG